MKRRQFVRALGAGLAGGLVHPLLMPLPRGKPEDRFVERWSWAMGQSVHVMVYAGSEAQGEDACAAVLAELRRVESRLTLFDEASDLCELNRHAGGRAMRVDDDLRTVLQAAERYRRQTGGAFNAAVEPLLRAWGFRAPRAAAPSRRELVDAEAAVVAATVELDGDRARLPAAHTQLDFGGIGVGYGIDRALALLASYGVRSAFLDVSGDCAALGPPPGADGWLVGIADPRDPQGILTTISLRDAALATSANSATVVRYGSWIIGHVMNPATGWPAHALRQASVVTGTAIAADALSTAMLVTGRPPSGVARAFAV